MACDVSPVAMFYYSVSIEFGSKYASGPQTLLIQFNNVLLSIITAQFCTLSNQLNNVCIFSVTWVDLKGHGEIWSFCGKDLKTRSVPTPTSELLSQWLIVSDFGDSHRIYRACELIFLQKRLPSTLVTMVYPTRKIGNFWKVVSFGKLQRLQAMLLLRIISCITPTLPILAQLLFWTNQFWGFQIALNES